MRKKVPLEFVLKGKDLCSRWLSMRLEEKGYESFASMHEIRGVIDEEVRELQDAMHEQDVEKIVHELKDVCVAAMFGLACIEAGTLDW